MPTKLENEELIREFLFGELPDEKQFEFEESFIKDADLFEQIKIVEDELIEKYVRGWLNPAERAKFEQHFLTTEKRRERVEFSRQFINKIQDLSAETAVIKKADEAISEESVWQKLAGIFAMPKIAMVTAFAVLIALFGSWFIFQNLNSSQTEVAQGQISNISKAPEIIKTPTPEIPSVAMPENTFGESEEDKNDADNSLIDEMPEKSPKITERIIEKAPTPTPIPKIKRSVPNPVLALFAGTLRSEGKNNILRLPEDAKGATLQLNLEKIDYKIYAAKLTDADGNVIFRKGGLKSRKSKVNLFIPANNLLKGDYLLELYGKNESGENESVVNFQFRVN